MARILLNPPLLTRWLMVFSLICGIGAQAGHVLVHAHESHGRAVSDCGHGHDQDDRDGPSVSSGETCLGCVLANERETAVAFTAPTMPPKTERANEVVAVASMVRPAPRRAAPIRGPPSSV